MFVHSHKWSYGPLLANGRGPPCTQIAIYYIYLKGDTFAKGPSFWAMLNLGWQKIANLVNLVTKVTLDIPPKSVTNNTRILFLVRDPYINLHLRLGLGG